MVWTATISSKGQLVLPKAVREKLGVGSGSKIILAERRGHIELQAYGGDFSRWYGTQQVKGPQDWDAVKQDSRKARAQEVIRESQSD